MVDRRWAVRLTLGGVIAGLAACSDGAGAPPAPEVLPPAVLSDGLTAHRVEVSGTNGLVTSGHPLASMAGIRILMEGGTAADAAVAILATLNSVEPMNSGAGGNGFVTLFDKASGQVYSLNATGAAPEALDADDLTAAELARGIKSGVTPGLFGGWIALLERFGTMRLGQVLMPAIEYAERGHVLDPYVASSMAFYREMFEAFDTTAAVYLPGGDVPVTGQIVRYSDLARTFRKLVEAEDTAAASGRSREQALRAAFDRFYSGDIAREMSRFYEEQGGLFTRADFAAYEPTWAEPVHTTYRGYDIYSSPPTSRGGLEVAMQLNLIEAFDVAALGHNSAETLHLVVESIKVAKSDVYHFVGDPTTHEVPIAGLLAEAFAENRRALIRPDRAISYPDHGLPTGVASTSVAAHVPTLTAAAGRSYQGSTTSFSVVDRFGDVVVCTATLGSGWGTGVVVAGTGLIFNNGSRHGSTSPYPDGINYARGGQIPVLNNAPTMVMKDGEFYMSLGTSGGETIGQTQFQVLVNVLDFGMGIQEAIEAPRVALSADPNFYRPGSAVTVSVEGRISSEVVAELAARGHNVEVVSAYTLGNMQGIVVSPETGTMAAGADPRRMMYAIGW